MIEIKKITKVYKSKKKNSHKALDNVSLTLPNNGLVFIIGKSGSGKSTLLNLLGGLDNTTSGSIIVDGNDITKFNERDLANYRNNHIGFIFQDYHLLDELTVYENIVLSLNLNKLEDSGLVLEALDKVGLSGYQNRYPQELSGGERQRVAIARAIVKKPYIILADEPTGNLDNETGTQIVSLLKELSNECLILIVSHNTIDTYKYADRIIKLSNGKIISDESKNPEYLDNVTYKEGVMYYPMDKTLTNEDINILNDKLDNKNIKKVVGVSDKYITTPTNQEERNIKIDKKNLSIKNIFKLCLTFLKSKVFRITASSFMIAVIMVILALAQTIITFDSGEIIANEMNKVNQNSLFMEKFQNEQDRSSSYKYYVEVSEEDIASFKNAGYEDEIYKVLNHTTSIYTSWKFYGRYDMDFLKPLYLTETLGTIIVDEEFLSNKFGKVEYIAKLDEFHPSGVIITDYIADALLLYSAKINAENYNDLLGELLYSKTKYNKGFINGIIKTNYKEKYKSVLSEIDLNSSMNLSEVMQNPNLSEFISEIYSSLGFSYTFNKNFVNDFKKENYYSSIWHYRLKCDEEFVTEDSLCYVFKDDSNSFNLKNNEVSFNYLDYNELYGTNYTISNLDSFVPHEATIKQYRLYDNKYENIILEEKIYIKSLHNKSIYNGTMCVSEEVYNKFVDNLLFTKGLYFNSNENIDKKIDVAKELNFEQKSVIVEGIHTMTKAVDVFIPIFELVAIVLCAGIVFILINFSTKMIKDKIHDIGILKALGCKNNTIGIVFGLQLLLIALCTIILSTIGYFFFIDLANDVLIESLKVLAPSHIVLDLDFLTFKMNIVYINSLLVVILSLISFVIPMLKIYKIKPVQIIKTKE